DSSFPPTRSKFFGQNASHDVDTNNLPQTSSNAGAMRLEERREVNQHDQNKAKAGEAHDSDKTDAGAEREDQACHRQRSARGEPDGGVVGERGTAQTLRSSEPVLSCPVLRSGASCIILPGA